MYYYIKELLNDDLVLIANALEEKTINIEDLNNTTDVVVGFNRITKAVKVSSSEDLLRYYNSKCKLSGREDLILNKEKGIQCYSFETVDKENLKIRVTIDISKIQDYEVYPVILISYEAIFEDLHEFCDIVAERVAFIEFYYILNVEGLNLQFIPYPVKDYVNTGTTLSISNIEFSSDTNINKLRGISGLFTYCIVDTDNSLLTTFGFTGSDADIQFMQNYYDLKGLKINRQLNLKDLFGGIIPNYIGFEFIGKYKEQDIVTKPCINTTIDLGLIRSILKRYDPDYEIKDAVTVLGGINTHFLSTIDYDISNIRCFDLSVNDILPTDKVGKVSVIDNSLFFNDNVFSFVKNISDETKTQMAKFMRNNLSGKLERFTKSTPDLAYKFLDKFKSELQKSKDKGTCSFLSKIKIEGEDDTRISISSNLGDYEGFDIELIILMLATLIDTNALCFDDDIYLIADGKFEDYVFYKSIER